jgi:hypothetical protein
MVFREAGKQKTRSLVRAGGSFAGKVICLLQVANRQPHALTDDAYYDAYDQDGPREAQRVTQHDLKLAGNHYTRKMPVVE